MDSPPPRRPSAAHDRPPRTPIGPRRQKNDVNTMPSTPSYYADAEVQVPSTPQKSIPMTFIAPPTLTPPPTVSFESTPIPWKGLPLEAAQWTFSSSELQEIVSKAIRLSARDSFVRLLSVQALEVDIVRESERLDAVRLETQAKWRFEVGRRTMLMQALNACAAFTSPSPGPTTTEHAEGIAGLVGQLASAIASCDSLFSTILQIADQQSQIALIQHQHWSSALGMALRKLNKAHERQGQDLKRAQTRVQTLEDELEEAWREAEKMAIEFDDLEQEIAESEGSDIMDQEDIISPRPDLDPKHDPDETGTLGDVTIQTDIAVVLGVTATAVASKATLIPSSANLVPPSPPPPPPIEKSDTRSIPSVKSTRSKRSTRDGPTHLSRLASARTRSRAASNASLRLPKALRSPTHPTPSDPPPMPALPIASVPGDSFLDMDNLSHEHLRKVPPKRHPEPTLALPTPPHSAGLPATHAPSIWLESDGGKPTRLTSLDRSHSLQIFSSLTPRKIRRSNLVMSLTGSDRSTDGDRGCGSTSGSLSPRSGTGSASSVEGLSQMALGSVTEMGTGSGPGTETGSPSPTLNHSPVSLPTHALAHFRGPSLSSLSQSSAGAATAPGIGVCVGVGVGNGSGNGSGSGGRGGGGGSGARTSSGSTRPGSAGARLTTTGDDKGRTRTPLLGSPRKSLVSRASSVILRRLSQATMGAGRMGAGGATVLGSPSRSREGSRMNGGRTLVDRWKDRVSEDDELEGVREGEVMLIGSPHVEASDML